MLYDMMPGLLRAALRMETATLPTEQWTWRHFCRYGRDPAKTVGDMERHKRFREYNDWARSPEVLPPKDQSRH